MSPEIAGQPTGVGGKNNALLKVTFSSLLRPSTEPSEDRRFYPIERACWHQEGLYWENGAEDRGGLGALYTDLIDGEAVATELSSGCVFGSAR